jgi:two-component system sensor histidine kinase DegS
MVAEAAAPTSALTARGFVRQFRTRLRDRRFWIVQALVIAISAGHTALEATHHLGVLPDLALLPVSTYFIPVVYAALNFGVEGAVPTALWCSALSIPNLILWHTAAQRPGVMLQLALLVVIAYVIARRVDFETAAKEHAEAANERLGRAQHALQQYVRLATDAQEEERKRLARELHDDTIQTLLVAKAELEAVAAEALPPGAAARLQRVDSTIGGAINDVRRFSRDLRPSLLDDLGLVDAIDWLVADLAARTGIDASLATSGEPRRLDQRDELALFRIIQEALHNVERHARATSVRVQLDFGDDVRATITDDGHGFDVEGAFTDRLPSGKLGLLGMRERAKLAGAELAITSTATGTRVTLALRA